jgi:ferredoxin
VRPNVATAEAADNAAHKGATMKIHVNPDKCQGHNRCYVLAPELFDVDDYGYATELNDGVVPDELAEKAQLAIANCPEHAVEVVEP